MKKFLKKFDEKKFFKRMDKSYTLKTTFIIFIILVILNLILYKF